VTGERLSPPRGSGVKGGADAEFALALGGGGARAAYQVGVLRSLSRRFPEMNFPVLTGVSAGAINTAILANHVGTFGESVDALARLWEKLEIGDVFRATPMSLVRQLLRTGAQLTAGVGDDDEIVNGMVDTSALREFLQRELASADGSLPGIAENLRTGRIRAAALTATRYPSGDSVTFCAGREIRTWNRPHRCAVATELTLDHVMASSSLPLFYPAVAVEGAWYGDGEIGLVAPLAPALHLGAERILAISAWSPRGDAAVAGPPNRPAPAEVMSVLYGAIFSDRLDDDAAHLHRVNRLVRALPPERRADFRDVDLLVIRPSVDLGAVVCEPGAEIPTNLRLVARRLDLRAARSRNLLSVVMLTHRFIARMLEIGERDGETRAADVARFLARRT
jgi:NTE family protein